jgi:putative molybdopterin biosynthesis protein
MPVAQYNAADVVGRPARRLKRLRAIREAHAMSQAELAQKAELSRATIGSLESGRAGAQYATIRRIAEALDVQPADLYGDDQP